ncbi:MAG TPA: hypothetical protein VGQ20_13885 [Acidimicrobiales bacterium]|nr:hypothetical protein [Acidimicrobiales bacterium]
MGHDSPIPASCTVEFGVTQFRHLLAALTDGDERAVRELIAEPSLSLDPLEIIPTFTAFTAVTVGSERSQIRVHTAEDLTAFMADIAGRTFELVNIEAGVGTGLQSGPGAYLGPAVGLGPIKWRARSSVDPGQLWIFGSGKAFVNCTTGKIIRALFTPMGYEY